MNDKELVARRAAEQVKEGMVVGLGTGSTANIFIEELSRRCIEEGLNIATVASSVVSAIKAEEMGLPLVSMENLSRIDLYVDGADEVAPDLTLLKGRGSDLVREKLLAKTSNQFVVLVDQSKLVDRIGARFPIPIEVIPFAWRMVKRSLENFGGRGGLRQNATKDGLAVTSHGSLVLDMEFDPEFESKTLNDILNGTPGVVEHGVFRELASSVLVGSGGQVEELKVS